MKRIDRSELRTYFFVGMSELGEFDVPMTVVDYTPTQTTIVCSDPVSVEKQTFRALRRLYRMLEEVRW